MRQRQATEDLQAAYSGGGPSASNGPTEQASWKQRVLREQSRAPATAVSAPMSHQLKRRIFELEQEIAALRQALDLKERQVRAARKTSESLQREIEDNYGVLSQIRTDMKILEDVARIDPVSTQRISVTLQRRLVHLRTRSDILEVTKLTEPFVDILRQTYPALTDAELQIVSFLRIGYSTSAIATACCISERTVENHRLRIRRKLALPKDEPLPEYLQMLDEHTSRRYSERVPS